MAAAEAAVAAVEASDLARLLTREHGKTISEAVFDAGDDGRHGGGVRPGGGRRAGGTRA